MKKRVLIYARRSSKKNKDSSISVKKQIDKLLLKCESKDYEVVWIYKDNQSGFKPWIRKEFNDMIKLINKKYKKWEKIDYIYVYWVSRLCRNTEESRLIEDLVNANKIKIKSLNWDYTDWLDAQLRLINDMNKAIFESKVKSEEAKINMDITYREKWRLAKILPYWYILWWRSWRDVLINNEFNESDIVKKVFNDYAEWTYTYKDIAKNLDIIWYKKYFLSKDKKEVKSRKFNEKDIENILIKDFYCWKVVITYKDLTDWVIKHFKETYPDRKITDPFIVDYTKYINKYMIYEPLISEELFNEVKNIRQGKKWTTKSKKDNKDIFIYEWILKCNCKKDIENNPKKYFTYTNSKTKKSNWTIYYNYKCSNNNRISSNKWDMVVCNNKNISEIELEKIIYEDFIKWIIFSDFEKEIFEEIITYKLKQLWKIKEDTNSRLKKRLTELEKVKKDLISDYRSITNEIVREELEKDLEKNKEEIIKTEEELKKLPNNLSRKEEHLKEYIYYINKLWTHFRIFPRIKKQKLIKAMFDFIIIENKKIVSYKLNPIFEFAIKRNRVGTFKDLTSKSKNKSSNSNNSLNKTKRTQSNDYVLYGSPTRSRT